MRGLLSGMRSICALRRGTEQRVVRFAGAEGIEIDIKHAKRMRLRGGREVGWRGGETD